MDTFFRIHYEFDKKSVLSKIDKRLREPGSDYICVADGVILNTANRFPEYLNVVNGGMFSICDSSFVPLYIRMLYGKRFEQYCGSEIFKDLISSQKYRMIFMGTQQKILDSLKDNLININPEINEMRFVELPYCKVEEFEYPKIAKMINEDRPDIIWIALGAPKQERFMNILQPYIHHGVMIAVGAAFSFFCNTDKKRAPKWMIENHLEFIYRIFSEPKKQLRRCGWIVLTLPKLLIEEFIRKYKKHDK